jgi:hypothetical protein
MFFSSLYFLFQVVLLKFNGRFLQLGHAAKFVGLANGACQCLEQKKKSSPGSKKHSPSSAVNQKWLSTKSNTATFDENHISNFTLFVNGK